MTEFIEVRDSRTDEPPTIDTTASAAVVYERRNIRQETRQEEFGEVTEWVYEQRTYTREEYEGMTSPATKAIMQAVSELELSVAMLG